MNIFEKIFGKKVKSNKLKPEAFFHDISIQEVEKKLVDWCKGNKLEIHSIGGYQSTSARSIVCSTNLSEHNKQFIDINPDRFWGIVITGNKYYTTPNKPQAMLMFRLFAEFKDRVKVTAESWAENKTQYGKTATIRDNSEATIIKLRDILYSLGGKKE